MCKCTPGIKTPWCGQPGCERPPQINARKLAEELDEVEAVERTEAVFDAAPWLKESPARVPGCLQMTFADLHTITTLARRWLAGDEP